MLAAPFLVAGLPARAVPPPAATTPALPAPRASADAAGAPVRLEDMTWTDVRAALAAGRTTVIVPVGGTEQSGPHLPLGKHNVRVAALAERIAAALGDALVAPVVSYVPEGAVSPPAGHMRYPGTISVSDAAFQGVLEGAARSFRQHGFRDIVLLGDHGGYQRQLAAVAERLDREWTGAVARVHYVADYYEATQRDYVQALERHGLAPAAIGEHAGAADTSLMLAVDPARVRADRYDEAARSGAAEGVSGDPRAASAALGRIGVDLVVARSVAAIRAAIHEPRPAPIASRPGASRR